MVIKVVVIQQFPLETNKFQNGAKESSPGEGSPARDDAPLPNAARSKRLVAAGPPLISSYLLTGLTASVV